MKPFVFSVLVATSVVHASSPERAIVAAMKVSELPNYAWTSTVSDDARSYDIEGKTVRGGYTWVRLPMVKSIAERLGRGAESEIEAVFLGLSRCVIRTGHGWKTLAELPKRMRSRQDDFDFWIPASARVGVGNMARAGLEPWGVSPLMGAVMPIPVQKQAEERRPYSNAQFGISHPHDELAVIVSCHTELKAEGETFSGRISDVGAQLLLVREGQDNVQPLAAAGSFRMRMKDGLVTKYQVQLEGILLVDGRRIHVHQVASTTLTAIGTTSVNLTAELQQKLAE